MMSCWARHPDDRPTFSEIVKKISSYTEVIAGYLDINFNPFETKYKQTGTQAATERDVLVSADILAKKLTSDKVKSKDEKNSMKSSPRASPCASPQSSPLLNVRKLSEEQVSSTSGIEIHIDSPSDDGSTANNDLKV